MAFILTALCWRTSSAWAHHAREYLATGSYETLHEHSIFVYLNEQYELSKLGDADSFGGETTPGFVFGLTDNLQLDTHFHMLDLPDEESTRSLFVESFALDVKYRLLEPGRLPVDLAFGVEYEQPTSPERHLAGTHPQLIPRLILAKHLPWGVDLDTNVGIRIEIHGEDRESKRDFAVAIKRPLTTWLATGLELLMPSDAEGVSLLPGLYFGEAHGLQVKMGLEIGLSKSADDLGVRVNVGYSF